jgi:hypothetical protein
MDTFVAAVFFVLACAMGLLILMLPGFAWFHLLKMQWPRAFCWSPLRMTLLCIPATILIGFLSTWYMESNFAAQSQRWLLVAVCCCLLQTPLFYWWSRR